MPNHVLRLEPHRITTKTTVAEQANCNVALDLAQVETKRPLLAQEPGLFAARNIRNTLILLDVLTRGGRSLFRIASILISSSSSKTTSSMSSSSASPSLFSPSSFSSPSLSSSDRRLRGGASSSKGRGLGGRGGEGVEGHEGAMSKRLALPSQKHTFTSNKVSHRTASLPAGEGAMSAALIQAHETGEKHS